MIEVKEEEIENNLRKYLWVDAQKVATIHTLQPGGLLAIALRNKEKILFDLKLSDLPEDVNELRFRLRFAAGFLTGAKIEKLNGQYVAIYQARIERLWNSQGTALDLAHRFRQHLEILKLPIKFDQRSIISGMERVTFPFGFEIVSSNEQIGRILASQTKVLESVYSEAVLNRAPDAVILTLDLPDSVRVPCEQYLLYFGQFLSDVGVDASVDLNHEQSKLLFSVTPQNQKDGLEKIKKALDMYLELPTNKLNEDSSGEDAIAIQRLNSNVLHLRSQLSLASALLQTKEKTIEALETTVALKQRMLDGSIMIESVKDVTPNTKIEDKEKLLGGRVEFGKLEAKGVGVNLGMLFRDLKKLFIREDDE